MRIGTFADSHDHPENIRKAVARFNEHGCRLVIFAGDFVSTIALPQLRRLNCPLIGCYADNEGNKIGFQAGMGDRGTISEAPMVFRAPDGLRFVVVHMLPQLRGYRDDFDVTVYGHTHRPKIHRDHRERLYLNPGELGGWTYGQPTVAILETNTLATEFVAIE